jgi:hypothetical protein
MKLYFVNHRSERRNTIGTPIAEANLIGEVETVATSGTHQLESFDEAGEHRGADNVDDGVTLAIGLVVRLTRHEEETAIVEGDAEAILCFAALTLLQGQVVEATGMALDLGVVPQQGVEIDLLLTIGGAC